jgi:hypothetical protein
MAALFSWPRRRCTDSLAVNDTKDTRASVLFQARFPEGPYKLDAAYRRSVFAEVGGRFGTKDALLGVVVSLLGEDREYRINAEAVAALFAASPSLHSLALALVRLGEDASSLDDDELRGQLAVLSEAARTSLALVVNPILRVPE